MADIPFPRYLIFLFLGTVATSLTAIFLELRVLDALAVVLWVGFFALNLRFLIGVLRQRKAQLKANEDF